MLIVFGKSGQVATELSKNAEVKCFGKAECDGSIEGRASEIIKYYNPELVINAAAYTDVIKAEKYTNKAFQLNAKLPREISKACYKNNVPIIHVSTDYVYGNSKDASIDENHPCNPINEYGKSKLAGERYIQEISARHIILRTAWLFSEHSTNFVKKILHQCDNETQIIKVVSDQVGSPSSAKMVAKVLIKMAEFLSRQPRNAEVYNYCGYPPVSWANFAKKIIDNRSLNIKIEQIKTNPNILPKRQKNSVLNCEKVKKDFKIEQHFWHDQLKEVLKNLDE